MAADNSPGVTTIQFDPTVFNVQQTITMTGGQLELGASMTIVCLAAGVTVSGNNLGRVFQVDSGVTDVHLQDSTMTGATPAWAAAC